MKNFILVLICLQFYFVSFAQIFNNLDEVTTSQGDLTAVRKGNQWGFINQNGTLVIDFRNDLVLTKNHVNPTTVSTYPVFRNDRCLIKELINGTYFFGYIDKKGKAVIKPSYLNAHNFENGFAIVLIPSKDVIGYNEVLKKDIISSKIEGFIIDTSGEVIKYLENPRSNDSPKTNPTTPPHIYSKFIAPHLIAVKKKDQKWDIYKFQ